MKLLLCQDCLDLIKARTERSACECGRHLIWREPPRTIVRDIKGAHRTAPRAFIVGISNPFIRDESSVTTPEAVQKHLDVMSRYHDFVVIKQAKSLIVKYRPGEGGQTMWFEPASITSP